MMIRSEQIAAMDAAIRTRFEHRMINHMRVRSAESETLPADVLENRALDLLRLGEQHGINREADLRRFLEFTFDHCPRPLEDPEVMAVLRGKLSSSAKAAFIVDILNSRINRR